MVYLDGVQRISQTKFGLLSGVGISKILGTIPNGLAWSREGTLPGVLLNDASSLWTHPSPSETSVNQLPRLLQYLLPSIYGIKNFLPGTQVHLDVLKILVRAKQ